eukprot:scaffold4465_cov113-Amphora_coffeaeformis.AAC.2
MGGPRKRRRLRRSGEDQEKISLSPASVLNGPTVEIFAPPPSVCPPFGRTSNTLLLANSIRLIQIGIHHPGEYHNRYHCRGQCAAVAFSMLVRPRILASGKATPLGQDAAAVPIPPLDMEHCV